MQEVQSLPHVAKHLSGIGFVLMVGANVATTHAG